ncbi:DUF1559 domain-containing protein, partial [bacterium]|nr:DUF1559 domain-containing protein [bacterium]
SFERGGRNNLTQITDGTSNTIVVGESESRGESGNNLKQPPAGRNTQRGSGGNNLKQSLDSRYGFNGREAAKQIQDGTSNTILLPETSTCENKKRK